MYALQYSVKGFMDPNIWTVACGPVFILFLS
jgi:hypothetical protein